MSAFVSYHPVGEQTLKPSEHKSSLYIWGQSANNQLGIESPDGCVLKPTNLPVINDTPVKQVAIGTTHTLFLTDTGVFSSGSSEFGQLGHNNNDVSKPVYVKGLEEATVISAAVGDSFSLALCDNGKLYSWGDNSRGQLGRPGHINSIPGLIKFNNRTTISQIACGESHCVALSKEGALYVWGSNQHGQLGLGSLDQSIVKEPQEIKSVRSIHYVQIAAGGSHSFALTGSGALFGWGKNSHGQLGLGSDESKAFPICCRSLRNLRVKYVSCGLNHTAALTQDGGVFTFGAGNHGQLGHCSFSNEMIPKKVLELMGSSVSQIACGRNHTLAYVPASDRLYSFGLGVYGQLGLNDSEKRQCPTLVPSVWRNNGKPSLHDDNLLYITAGGNGSLAFVVEKAKTMVTVEHHNLTDLISLHPALIEVIMEHSCSALPDLSLPPDLQYIVECVFSFSSAWNGAFLKLDGSHYGCSSTNHGIDVDKAKESLSSLGKCSHVLTQQLLAGAMEKKLLPSLTQNIPDVEALRIFLILPFLHLFNDYSNYLTIHAPYGDAVLSLNKTAASVLERWLKAIASRHFKYYLNTFKNCLKYILAMDKATTEYEVLVRQRGMLISLEMMKKFYNINESTGEQIVSCYEFYIPEIADKVDIKSDYINWFSMSHQGKTVQPALVFCNYTFVFDAQAKTILLHADAVLQMQQAIEEAHRRNLLNILCSPAIDPVHPCLVLTVSRENIVADTLIALTQHTGADLKKPLKVKFKNEEAVDEGGVRKEFFLLLLKEVLDLKYGMFQYHEETRLLWFNSISFEDSSMFHLIGILCGLAIYNTTIIYLPFPLALYKKLLSRPVNLDDLRELEPQMAKSFQDLLDYEGDDVEDVFCQNFTTNVDVFGESHVQSLIPNGANTPVTTENRQQYVDSYLDFMFNQSVKGMYDAFSEGFLKVCGSKVLSFFHPTELQAMVIGNEEYDWNELEKNCEYKGEFYRGHQTILFFWEVFHDLSLERKKKFLMFLTGCDRIPIQGMKSLKIYLQPCGAAEQFLPVAHTCFNLLDMPKYSSKDTLREKLCIAISNTQGFGLV